MRSVLCIIEEATLRDLPASSFVVAHPVNPFADESELMEPVKTVALPWDSDAVKRLICHIRIEAEKAFGRCEDYENARIKDLEKENAELRNRIKRGDALR